MKHTIDEEYIFIDTNLNINENSIIGHSHQQYKRNLGSYVLVNPGSLGQNRNYINISNYIIWDVEKGVFNLKYLTYDVNMVITEMKKRSYPLPCINYYKNKSTY